MEEYILAHIDPEPLILTELDRATHLSVVQPRMLSGHLQGQLLTMLVKILNPLRVLELGTFTGYSAIAMARGMKEGSKLHTIEIDDELESIASQYVNKAHLDQIIDRHIGDAREVIPRLGGTFDLVFIDADKRHYPAYYQLIMDGGYVKSGSVIIADNVLWNGKVIETASSNDLYTLGVQQFNDMVSSDNRVEKVIIPLRDGLSIIRVK